jgi:hypothetical protein
MVVLVVVLLLFQVVLFDSNHYYCNTKKARHRRHFDRCFHLEIAAKTHSNMMMKMMICRCTTSHIVVAVVVLSIAASVQKTAVSKLPLHLLKTLILSRIHTLQ